MSHTPPTPRKLSRAWFIFLCVRSFLAGCAPLGYLWLCCAAADDERANAWLHAIALPLGFFGAIAIALFLRKIDQKALADHEMARMLERAEARPPT